MSDRPPYSRIYWTVMDDVKFEGIREDVRLFGSWSLCLVVADMAWPASAFVPPTVPRASFRRLVEAELVDELPGHRYRVRGLDKEREKRSASASHAANERWGNAGGNAPRIADGNATGNAETMPSRGKDEAETRQAEAEAARAPDPADVYWTLTGRYPTDKVLGWLDDLAPRYGPIEVIKALGKAHAEDRSAATLLGRTTDLLRAEARALSLKAQESERQRLKERRSSPREIVDPAALEAEIQRILRGEAA